MSRSLALNELQNDYRNLSNDAKRKFPAIKEQCETAIMKLKEINDGVTDPSLLASILYQPFQSACETRQLQFVNASLHGIQKLIMGKFLSMDCVMQIIGLLQRLSTEHFEEIRIIQTIILLITSDYINPEVLAYSLSICFHLNFKNHQKNQTLNLKAKDINIISGTAGAAIQQILAFLMEKACKLYLSSPNSKEYMIVIDEVNWVFKDLCLMGNGEKSVWITDLPDIKYEFILELIEHLLDKFPFFFKTVPECASMIKELICPLVIKLFSPCIKHYSNEGGNFYTIISTTNKTFSDDANLISHTTTSIPETIKTAKNQSILQNNNDDLNGVSNASIMPVTLVLTRIVLILVKNYGNILIMECEIFMSMLYKFTEPEKPLWLRTISLETLFKLAQIPELLKWLYLTYDARDRGESLKIFEMLLQTLENCTRVEFLEKEATNSKRNETAGSNSKNVAGNGGDFVFNVGRLIPLTRNPINLIRDEFKTLYLDTNADKFEALVPTITENYTITILCGCVNAFIKSAILLNQTNDLLSEINVQMIDLAWIKVLSCLTIMLDFAYSPALIDAITYLILEMIVLCGTLKVTTALTAFVTTLCKSALPFQYPYLEHILISHNTSKDAIPIDYVKNDRSPSPSDKTLQTNMLSSKNYRCLTAILNLVHDHGHLLGTVWLTLISTINHIVVMMGLGLESYYANPKVLTKLTEQYNSSLNFRDPATTLLTAGGGSSKLHGYGIIKEDFSATMATSTAVEDTKKSLITLFERSGGYDVGTLTRLFDSLIQLFLQNIHIVKNNPKESALAFFPIAKTFDLLHFNVQRSSIFWDNIVQQFLVHHVIMYTNKLTIGTGGKTDKGSPLLPSIFGIGAGTAEMYLAKSFGTALKDFTDKSLINLVKDIVLNRTSPFSATVSGESSIPHNHIMRDSLKNGSEDDGEDKLVVSLTVLLRTLVSVIRLCTNDPSSDNSIKLAHLSALLELIRDHGYKLFHQNYPDVTDKGTNLSQAVPNNNTINDPEGNNYRCSVDSPPIIDVLVALGSVPDNKTQKYDTEQEFALYNQCLITGFQCLQLIVNDTLPRWAGGADGDDIQKPPHSFFDTLLNSISNYASQRAHLNISLTSIGLLWNIADHFHQTTVVQAQENPNEPETPFKPADHIVEQRETGGSNVKEIGTDSSAGLYDHVWVLLFTKISHACLDPRPTIRKSGCQTLFSTLEAHGNLESILDPTRRHILWNIILPLAERIRLNCYETFIDELNSSNSDANQVAGDMERVKVIETTISNNNDEIVSKFPSHHKTKSFNSQSPSSIDGGSKLNSSNSTGPILIHHSRDSQFKQWSETLTITIDSLCRIFTNRYINITLRDLYEIWSWVTDYALRCVTDIESNEVILAVLKLSREFLDFEAQHEIILRGSPAGLSSPTLPPPPSSSEIIMKCYLKLWSTYVTLLRELVSSFEKSLPPLLFRDTSVISTLNDSELNYKTPVPKVTVGNLQTSSPQVNFVPGNNNNNDRVKGASATSTLHTDPTFRQERQRPSSDTPQNRGGYGGAFKLTHRYNNVLTMLQLFPLFLRKMLSLINNATVDFIPTTILFNNTNKKDDQNGEIFELWFRATKLPVPRDCFNASFFTNFKLHRREGCLEDDNNNNRKLVNSSAGKETDFTSPGSNYVKYLTLRFQGILSNYEQAYQTMFWKNSQSPDDEISIPITHAAVLESLWMTTKIYVKYINITTNLTESTKQQPVLLLYPKLLLKTLEFLSIYNNNNIYQHLQCGYEKPIVGGNENPSPGEIKIFDPIAETYHQNIKSNIEWIFIKPDSFVSICYIYLNAILWNVAENSGATAPVSVFLKDQIQILSNVILKNFIPVFSEKSEALVPHYNLDVFWDTLFIITRSYLSTNDLGQLLSILQCIILDVNPINNNYELPQPPVLVLKHLKNHSLSLQIKPSQITATASSSSSFGFPRQMSSPVNPSLTPLSAVKDSRQIFLARIGENFDDVSYYSKLKIKTALTLIRNVLLRLGSDEENLSFRDLLLPLKNKSQLDENLPKYPFLVSLYDLIVRAIFFIRNEPPLSPPFLNATPPPAITTTNNHQTSSSSLNRQNSFSSTYNYGGAASAANINSPYEDKVRNVYLELVFELARLPLSHRLNSSSYTTTPFLNAIEGVKGTKSPPSNIRTIDASTPLLILLEECYDIMSNYLKDADTWSKYPLSRARTSEIISTLKIVAKTLTFLQNNSLTNKPSKDLIWDMVLKIYDSLVNCLLSNSRQICGELQNTLKLFKGFLKDTR